MQCVVKTEYVNVCPIGMLTTTPGMLTTAPGVLTTAPGVFNPRQTPQRPLQPAKGRGACGVLDLGGGAGRWGHLGQTDRAVGLGRGGRGG